MSEPVDALMAYIRDHLAQDPGQVTSPDEPLISSGILDSMCVVELLAFFEDEFGVVLPDDQVRLENLDTVSRMLTTVDANRS